MPGGQIEVVEDGGDGDTLGGAATQRVHHEGCVPQVEGRRRLVEQHIRRRLCQHPGQRHPGLFTCRQLGVRPVCKVGRVGVGQTAVDHGRSLTERIAVRAATECDDLARGERHVGWRPGGKNRSQEREVGEWQ